MKKELRLFSRREGKTRNICPECNQHPRKSTCYRCFTGEPTPEGYNNITKPPEKDGLYQTICLIGSFDKVLVPSRDWYKNGTWRSFDWSRVLAWR